MGQDEPGRRRISLDLSDEMVKWLDSLKPEYGLRARGAIVERLLTLLRDEGDDEGDAEPTDVDTEAPTAPGDRQAVANGATSVGRMAESDTANTGSERRPLEDNTAIVLIRSALVSQRGAFPDQGETGESAAGSRRGSQRGGTGAGGIQLPGFVRRQARELRRSLQVQAPAEPERGLALIGDGDLHAALERVEQHWNEVYGQPANEPVLEAAMVWLARDVWPQSDHSDGRPFSWSLAQLVVQSFAPTWPSAPASLARVITTAGVLEDPFSGSTLALRVPTLINRFVQRHRSRQKRTTSFEAIDQTMTVHSALKLLELPTVADRPYTFKEIRDAYREQAQNHHPDAGGSAEAMRRLNEAYQFLKERYRRAS